MLSLLTSGLLLRKGLTAKPVQQDLLTPKNNMNLAHLLMHLHVNAENVAKADTLQL